MTKEVIRNFGGKMIKKIFHYRAASQITTPAALLLGTVTGQNGSGQNGVDKMVHGQNGMDKMVQFYILCTF